MANKVTTAEAKKPELNKPALYRSLVEGDEDVDLIHLLYVYLTHESIDRRDLMSTEMV